MYNNKKSIILGTAFTLLLSFLPIASFSANQTEEIVSNPVSSGIYFTGQYKPGISNFTNFSAKETNFNTTKLARLKKDAKPENLLGSADNFVDTYSVKFQNNIISFSGIIGYTTPQGIRLEIEGAYESFDVKSPEGYSSDSAYYRYFALVRSMNKEKPKEFTVMKNNGLSVTSIMLNGCYDFRLNDLPLSPYVCAGIGEDFIEFFDTLHIKLAYQGKVGLNYYLSPKISLFVDGYYHHIIGNQFKNLHIHHSIELSDFPKSSSAVATLDIGYFGGEVGARFIF
ncbi:P44/Msp2 family outer membrane protein [Ehrlichia ruminantium]|uniref:P44/Msp2 family outer membrane protein n=1 Tax=Ehrlichia ruminantium TaxID=779 RepID=A0AAE6UL35_EHRRU|nr:P44/Msp2 family outer membrane protein [Ehrlichia ruminantium]QGR02929.1 P44/Msp2 family outer membrane protein [Ehrlichia ruminantium]QGR03853.1 P44/Msp2 family outer membrane protein [Ehrlichia ruminantium]QGR04780.1 P44/Msp2 family outer membrane protein [Ehrlichia ruminantium]